MSHLEGFDGFAETKVENGFQFQLECGVPQALLAPGSGGVAVVCRGAGQFKTEVKKDYEADLGKFRDALNTAAPVLNKRLQDAAKASEPPLQIVCDLPPAAGAKPGIDAGKVPAAPRAEPFALKIDYRQWGRLGSLVNDAGAGVYGFYEGIVDPKTFRELIPNPTPQWKRITYFADASWACVVVGQSDAFNMTSIPSSGPLQIKCPFPETPDAAKSVSCEQGSSSATTIAASFNTPGGANKIAMKFGEQVTFGLDFSHDSKSAFLRDGTTTKLRSGAKVTVSLKAATISSLEQSISLGVSTDLIGVTVEANQSEELSVGRGASNFFVTTKDMTQAEFEAELKKKYAIVAGLAATVASMNDNKAKFESLFRKSTTFYKREPRRGNVSNLAADASASDAPTLGAGCDTVALEGALQSVALSSPATQHDDFGCADQDDDGDPGSPDGDDDGDGIPDDRDNCAGVANADQADGDGDGNGDACDVCTGCSDDDGDGVPESYDNCPGVANPDQLDGDHDGLGEACDADSDGDGIPNPLDSCPGVRNDGSDVDQDGTDDACDACLLDHCPADSDGDGVADTDDNCPWIWNASLDDADGDGIGDACEPAPGSDGIPDDREAPTTPGTPTTSNLTASSVTLSWAASTDNVGVTGYDIFRATGTTGSTFTSAGSATTTTFTDTNLDASTPYRYQARARDAAGNLSAFSAPVTVTTSAGAGGNAGCTATYTIMAQWPGPPGGFTANINVTNGTTASAGWTITWTFANGQTITSLWSGQETPNGAAHSVRNLPWNGALGPNQTTSFGFTGSWNGTNAIPALTCTRS